MDPNQFPARFEVSGVVMNVYQKPEGKSKDGVMYGGEWFIQLMSADHLRNGESKLVPTDLLLGKDPQDKAEAEKYRGQVGKTARLPATVYVGRQNQLVVGLARLKGTANVAK